MKKKILIPTDFSKSAWNAVTYAAELFKNKECEFYILNAFMGTGYTISEMMVPEPGTISYDSAEVKSKKGLDHVMEMLDFRDDNPKHQYFTISQFNDPISAIKNSIEKKDIELVVMGTKGANNYKGTLFGSNTISAMEQVRNCPVLCVPLEARIVRVKEIVFPTSFKTHYKRRELIHLVELAQLQDANICILHVSKKGLLSKESDENKDLLEECLTGASYSLHHIEGSDPTMAVKHFIASRNSDMVAFINRKHTFFKSIFNTPMVKELGMFSTVPLLAMHDLRN